MLSYMHELPNVFCSQVSRCLGSGPSGLFDVFIVHRNAHNETACTYTYIDIVSTLSRATILSCWSPVSVQRHYSFSIRSRGESSKFARVAPGGQRLSYDPNRQHSCLPDEECYWHNCSYSTPEMELINSKDQVAGAQASTAPATKHGECVEEMVPQRYVIGCNGNMEEAARR